MTTEPTNPEVGAGEAVADVNEGVDTDALDTTQTDETEGSGSPEVEYDDDGNEIEPAEELDEIEFEGVKGKVPKTLAEALKLGAMRTADYTKKTQDVAAQRQQLDQARASLDQEAAQRRQAIVQEETLVREHAAELVGYRDVIGKLAQYEKLTPQDWANMRAQDPGATSDHQFNYQQLKDARDRAASAINTKAQELDKARQNQAAIQAQQSGAYLAREIPNWGQETFNKLGSIALEYGYQAAEVGQVMNTDPRAFKGLQEIASLRAEVAALKAAAGKSATSTTVAKKAATAQVAAPIATISGGTTPRKLDIAKGEGSTDEWMRARNAEVARRRAAARGARTRA